MNFNLLEIPNPKIGLLTGKEQKIMSFKSNTKEKKLLA